MTKLLFFVFLFGLLHLGDAWSQSYENSFFVGQPRFTSFAIPVLGSPLKLNLVSTNNSAIFVLCGQRHFQPTADFKSWNAKTCQFYADTNSSTPTSNDNTPRISRRTRQTFASEQEIGRDLVPGSYWVGIFVQNMGANASFTFSGQDCSSGQFGSDCSIAVTRIIEWNQNDTLSFQNADDVKYLELKVDRTQTNIANLSFELQTQGSSHYDVNFRLFYGTLPLNMSNPLLWSTGMTVNNKTSVLTVGGGSDGDYIVVLSPTKTRAKRRVFEDDFPLMMTWSTQLTKCLTTRFGPNCQNATKINATTLSQVFTYSSTPNTFDYFYFSDTASQVAFNMTVQSKSGSSNAPALYVRKGAAPTELLYDGVSANSSVNSINLGAHDGGKWFFGVLGTGSDYAIWINTQCPNGCSSNGNCVLSNGAYSCQCNDGYELFDCSQKKDSGFKTEYIVLIVIGSIIALAALVGLIVYLYNRGKHPGGGYERI